MTNLGAEMIGEAGRLIQVFRGMDADTQAALTAILKPIHLPRGEVVFRSGDKPDALYVIVEGKIKLTKQARNQIGDPAAKESLLAIYGPGQMFGELSLFDPGPRNSTATTLTAVDLRKLEREDLERALAERPALSLILLRQLASRLRAANDLASDLVLSDVTGRVAKVILELAKRFGERTPTGIEVRHDMTQAEIATMVGASRETVNKLLVDFVNRGWISLASRSITIHDDDKLRHRAA